MSDIQRYGTDPYQQLSQVIREAQRLASRPPTVRGSTQERQSHTQLPDGTRVDVYERTTRWEVEW